MRMYFIVWHFETSLDDSINVLIERHMKSGVNFVDRTVFFADKRIPRLQSSHRLADYSNVGQRSADFRSDHGFRLVEPEMTGDKIQAVSEFEACERLRI